MFSSELRVRIEFELIQFRPSIKTGNRAQVFRRFRPFRKTGSGYVLCQKPGSGSATLVFMKWCVVWLMYFFVRNMFYLTHDELCCVDIFRLQELNAFLKPEEKDIILFMWEQINVLKPILICFIYFWSEVIIPPPKKNRSRKLFHNSEWHSHFKWEYENSTRKNTVMCGCEHRRRERDASNIWVKKRYIASRYLSHSRSHCWAWYLYIRW